MRPVQLTLLVCGLVACDDPSPLGFELADVQPVVRYDVGQPDGERPDATPLAPADAALPAPDGAEDATELDPDGASDAEPDGDLTPADAEPVAPDAAPPPFAPPPYGAEVGDVAGPFTVPTTDGDFVFEERFTSAESYVFVFYAAGQPPAEQLWSSDLPALLEASPLNVHYFFVGYSAPDFDLPGHLASVKARADAALAGMNAERRAHWVERLHYGAAPAQRLGGWLGEAIQAYPGFVIAVDRFQRRREVGSLGDPNAAFALTFRQLALAVRGYNFEWTREAELAARLADADSALTVDATQRADEAPGSEGTRFDLRLPEADPLARFDRLLVDLSLACADHRGRNCGALDLPAQLYVCAAPAVAENPFADVACTPGTNDGPPDARPCQCVRSDGSAAAAQYVCRPDGTGYGACGCPCDDEIARWVTPFSREGRWVTDITPMLAHFKRGGAVPLLYRSEAQPNGAEPMIDLKVHLLDEGRADHPDAVMPLFTGGPFDAAYNLAYDELEIDIPDDVTRVELHALITGRGFGAEVAQCAEFCNHTHHFWVNGQQFVKVHPEAGTLEGCADKIELGVVPNQFGDWARGRGGWCPGQDVVPFVVDLTDVVVPGLNTIRYEGLWNGTPYSPEPTGQPGAPAEIDMQSSLVFWR